MAILKKEYELSVWTEEMDSSGKKTEKKGIIIGGNTMNYLGRATGIKLKREIKGTNTLTFQMPSKFFDNEKGEFVKNEFTDYLFNEAKIKLHFMDMWFEFVVKKITEEKRYKAILYNYECEDSFIDELSRTGYEIHFQEEFYNNVDELGNFMEITLEDSIWDYRPDLNNGDFTEFSEQRFYKIPLALLGGKITGHLIELDVESSDIVNTEWGIKDKDENGEPIPKDWVDKDYKRVELQNLYTKEKRKLQYGDDLAREQRLFYDPYKGEHKTNPDNGRAFLNAKETTIEDSNGFIYVPYTDLSYVYGNFVADSYKSTSVPAFYGNYQDNKGKKKYYALQPKSANPYDLIQFIYFTDKDEIKIDEAGTIMNMNCHYVIKVEDWNSLVTKALGEDAKNSHLYWQVDTSTFQEQDDKNFFSGTYEYSNDGDLYYTKNVMPETSLTDDFNWTPIYADGYLDKIGNEEVFAARKISITDRTELNKKYESYVTVYNNKSSEYDGKYSEEDFNSDTKNPDAAKGYRVCSAQDTRIILPTLAKNLVENGTKITDENGWESRTQKSETEYNTASYENLLKVEARNISSLGKTDEEIAQEESTAEVTGQEEDESVSDFYLQVTSPYISRCTDLDAEGQISEDVLLNFGLTSQEKKIEKGKTYAIKLITLDKDKDETKKQINEKITDVVIGEGSCNLDGNYLIAGYDNTDDNISFSNLYEEKNNELVSPSNLYFLPDGTKGNGLYNVGNHEYKNKKWNWSGTDGIEDSPFLLFKSDKTIDNPYIGLKVKSKPMTLTVENPEIDMVSLNNGKGVTIAIRSKKKGSNNQHYYVDGIKIGVNPFTTSYYDEEWVNKANAYRESAEADGNLNSDFDDFGSVKSLRAGYSWKATSSSTTRIVFTGAQLADTDSDSKSMVYALYLDDKFYGIFWLTRNQVQETPEESEDTQTQALSLADETIVEMPKVSYHLAPRVNYKNVAVYAATPQAGTYHFKRNGNHYEIVFPKTVIYSSGKWHNGSTKLTTIRLTKYTIGFGRATSSNSLKSSTLDYSYGFKNGSYSYSDLTKELFIDAARFNSLSKSKKIASAIKDSTGVFSLSWLNKGENNNYFWFQGNNAEEAWNNVPCPLYNYYCYNLWLAASNRDTWIRGYGAPFFLKKGSQYAMVDEQSSICNNPSALGQKLKAAFDKVNSTNREGFYWGLGYYDNKGKPKTGNYYLVLTKGTISNKNNNIKSYYTALTAEGDNSSVITKFSEYLSKNAASIRGKITDGYIISLESTGKANAGKDLMTGPYYKVLWPTNEDGTNANITLEKLKEIISENSQSTDSGYNDDDYSGGGVSGYDRPQYTPPVRDPSSIVTPDYIINYNLYDLHFRAEKNSEPGKSNLDSRIVKQAESFLCLNLAAAQPTEENQRIAVSDVAWLMETIDKKQPVASDFFKELDSELDKIKKKDWYMTPSELPVGDDKELYHIKIKPLVTNKKDFNENRKYSQQSAIMDKPLSTFFNTDTDDRVENYKLAFYDENGDYKKDLTFEDFLTNLNEALRYSGSEFHASLILTQEPNILNIYTFELFEAYTRGRDFVEYNYTTLRPNEEAYRLKISGQRESMFKNSNYFSYKYSGREFDLTKFTDKTHVIPKTDIKIALVHSKDLLQESDVTLGDSYTYDRYFIEAIKYNDGDKTLYKDTFMIKDYVEAVDATKYIEDDLEILTGNIDLLQCNYYKPQDATYENKWCDCCFGSTDEGGKCTRECLYEKKGYCPYLFQTEKHPRKIRTLSVEKSNRFNIIQETSKVFEIYPQFYIEHDENGKILLDENGRMKKHVFFITEKGKDNKMGFRYEKNLSSISRTVDSSSITTRLFVENIDTELSKTGMCSIQSAEDNLGKNSYILNFSYYILKGILDREQVERDLYGIDMSTDLAFLPTIGYYNTKYDDLSNLITNMTGEAMTQLQAENTTWSTGVTTALEERKKIANIMYQFKIRALQENKTDYTTSDTYIGYLTKYKEYATIIWGNIESLIFSDSLFWYNGIIYNMEDTNENSEKSPIQILRKGIDDKYSTISLNTYYNYLKNKYCKSELWWRLFLEGFDENDIEKAGSSEYLSNSEAIKTYKPVYETWQQFKTDIIDKNLYESCGTLGQFRSMYNQVKVWRKTRAKYLNKINDLTSTFYKKYEPFIKEGTWSDSDYLDDNEYYWAAEHVLEDSCKPQITYSISVIDLSAIFPDDYDFELADTTFVEDIDFFGINQKTGLPNKQKVLISGIDYNLDEPSQNSITVQNYTTQFDDLFQQISASVQSLTFNENTYKRASNFTATHIVAEDSLQGALDEGDFTLINTRDENIVIDENGAQGKDINNMASQYKLTGEGLFFSKDGGQTWDIGVGPSGINADYLKAGQIDSSKVQIMDSGYIYFLWDKSGITAYRNPSTSTTGLVDFTRFNKYGLSLVENNNIRLRAGYEFRTSSQSKESYNTTGDYTQEAELSTQNVGFYLYNDSGIPIFKTETQSEFNDSTTDYSARLSMTGEMFITNDVLAGQSDGSAIYQQVVYKTTGAYFIKSVAVNNMTQLSQDSLEYTLLWAGEQQISESGWVIQRSSIEGKYLSSIELKDLNSVSSKSSYYLFEMDGTFNGNYLILADEGGTSDKYLKIYRLEYEDLQTTENYYLLNNKLYHTTNDDNSSIILRRQKRLYGYLKLELKEGEEANYDNINKFLNEKSKEDLESSIQYIQYVQYQKTDSNTAVWYESSTGNTVNVLTSYEKDAQTTMGTNTAEKTSITYYDCTENVADGITPMTKTLYHVDGVYKTITYNYWDKAEATEEIETTESTGVKTQTVGIFINNKKLGAGTISEADQLEEGETSAEKISSVIGGGSERVFTICLKGEDTTKNQTVYKNVLSVLKNGCAYLGGEIKNSNKSNLDIESMDYLPDEISIVEPSMVVANNGVIVSDWETMFDFTKDSNGKINGIGVQSLGALLDKLSLGGGGGGSSSSSSSSSGDVALDGYYLADPLG